MANEFFSSFTGRPNRLDIFSPEKLNEILSSPPLGIKKLAFTITVQSK
jgi:hypothetical protein